MLNYDNNHITWRMIMKIKFDIMFVKLKTLQKGTSIS